MTFHLHGPGLPNYPIVVTGNLNSMSCDCKGAVDYMRMRARVERSLFKEHEKPVRK